MVTFMHDNMAQHNHTWTWTRFTIPSFINFHTCQPLTHLSVKTYFEWTSRQTNRMNLMRHFWYIRPWNKNFWFPEKLKSDSHCPTLLVHLDYSYYMMWCHTTNQHTIYWDEIQSEWDQVITRWHLYLDMWHLNLGSWYYVYTLMWQLANICFILFYC